MTFYRKILILMSSLIITTASCTKEDSSSSSTSDGGDKEYSTVPFSITIGIAPSDDGNGGVGLKQSFSLGDVIEISNTEVLYEPLKISADSSIGKSSANFSAELKVKKGAELLSGSTKLSAVLKNGNNYNNGRPFADVKKITSLAEGLEKYGYWSCDSFTYGSNDIILRQSTVFLKVNLFRTTLSMQYGVASYSEIVGSECLYALPSGIVVECKSLNINQRLDSKEKLLYQIEYPVPKECLPGIFSVGEGKYVFFSKGNLQYRPLDGSWRLAPQQYHQCFTKSTNVGVNYSEWMGEDKWTDIFAFGAFIEGENPCYITPKRDYPAPVDADGKLKNVCAYGAEWTILDQDEWRYLIEKRPDALQKRVGGIVGNIWGLIILPDDWCTPEGVAPLVWQYDENNLKELLNKYTDEEWAKMESAGAIFLPETNFVYSGSDDITKDIVTTGDDYQSLTYDVSLNGSVSLYILPFFYSNSPDNYLRYPYVMTDKDVFTNNSYKLVRLIQKLDFSDCKLK